VPANPETWEVDPFHLTRDGDLLYGRGTTDCLGHVALLTDLFCSLAEARPPLARTVVGVFIANEENGEIAGEAGRVGVFLFPPQRSYMYVCACQSAPILVHRQQCATCCTWLRPLWCVWRACCLLSCAAHIGDSVCSVRLEARRQPTLYLTQSSSVLNSHTCFHAFPSLVVPRGSHLQAWASTV
jgi:Peptidase family M20/M25/M40